MTRKVVPPNPSGLCECGCGQKTDIAERNNYKAGWAKGHPKRFVSGHQSRKPGKLFLVNPETGCWIWQRYLNAKGYGMMRVPGKKNMQLSHRAFYEQAKGPIPTGRKLHHKCETPACVNPDHLEPVTPLAHSRKHKRKLTPEQVRIIRALYVQGEITQAALAQLFGVSPALISFAVTERYWKDID